MKKEVLVKLRNKDFLEFLKEEIEGKVAWVYINKAMILNLREQCEGVTYRDTNSKLHIPYGKVVIDGYNDKCEWNRIDSIESNTICYSLPSDPNEILFIAMEE